MEGETQRSDNIWAQDKGKIESGVTWGAVCERNPIHENDRDFSPVFYLDRG